MQKLEIAVLLFQFLAILMSIATIGAAGLVIVRYARIGGIETRLEDLAEQLSKFRNREATRARRKKAAPEAADEVLEDEVDPGMDPIAKRKAEIERTLLRRVP